MRELAVLFALSVAIPIASATTYLVKPDGTGDFPTIQAAIDASQPGGEVLLSDGTFTGDGNRDLHFGKSLTLRSQSGKPSACTIDCQGSSTDFHRGICFAVTEHANAATAEHLKSGHFG